MESGKSVVEVSTPINGIGSGSFLVIAYDFNNPTKQSWNDVNICLMAIKLDWLELPCQ